VFVQFLWWLSIAAELLLLVRAIKGRFIGEYSIFYLYLGTILIVELLRFLVYTFQASSFPLFYWRSDYFMTLIGFAVILEIYKHAFEKFPGAVRASYVLLAGVLFVVLWRAPGIIRKQGPTMAWLERDMRFAQGLLLLAIIWLLVHYAIPVGRNFIGIVLGYSLYVATSISTLAIGSQLQYNPRPEWRTVTPLVYTVVLLVWCITLWSYRPNPEPGPESMFERDYQLIAQRTKGILSKAFSYLKLGAAEK
jgi:hypothetical protein